MILKLQRKFRIEITLRSVFNLFIDPITGCLLKLTEQLDTKTVCYLPILHAGFLPVLNNQSET